MKRKFHSLLTALVIFGLISGISYAQSGTTGSIEGKIIDEEGNPLPGAQVKASSPDLIGGAQSKVASAEGRFRFVALPSGAYTLEASLAGFTSVKRDDIKIFVGQTITIDLVLQIGKLEQEVTVTGTSPLIDVKDSQMNATNLDKQMLETVGEQMRFKSSTSLINLAPGIKDDSAMGAPSRVSNQWQMDGQSLLTYIGSGADWSYPDMNIIEEAQVSGSGANAEYGNFTGAVLNLITKSGGNTFEGLVATSYSPLNWNQKNFNTSDPKFSLFSTPPRSLYFDAHLGIGGPIIKDKLWFYASGGFIQGDSEVMGGGVVFKERESEQIPKGFGKLTYQAGRNTRLSAFVEYELFQVFNRGLGVDRPLSATYFDVGPGIPTSLNLLQTFSENTFAEVKLGYYYSLYDQRPNQGMDVSQRYDSLTGMYSGNYGYWGDSASSHYTGSASISHHAEDFIKGSHDFKIGVEFLKGFDNVASGYPGGFNYTDNYYSYYDYQYHTYAYTYGYDLKANGWRASAFVQDSWKISDRLTINPGLRWSMQRGYLPNVGEAAFFKPKSSWEGRLGLTFDIFGDHTTAFKAHYGRFHESFKTYFYNGADPGYQDWVCYDVRPGGQKIEVWRQAYSANSTMAPGVRIPYSDQFTVGLERTMFTDIVVGVTFMYRVYKDFIARMNATASWEQFPYTYKDENGAQQTIMLYEKTESSPEDHFVIGNPRAGEYGSVIITPKNTYSGITFSINKRFSNNWMLHFDYTYSQTKGNHTNSTTASWGGIFYESPNRQINASGYLPFDAPHAVNIYGTVALPFDIVLTPRFSYQSGWNWTPYVKVSSISGSPSVNVTSRGSKRLPAQISFDIRAEKVFAFSQKMKISLIFDAFNIFNRGVETTVENRVTLATYGKAKGVCEPRFFRVGMKFYF